MSETPLATLDEINYETAYRAYSGISMVPDERARQEQESFVAEIQGLYDLFLPAAEALEKVDVLRAEVLRYKERYRRHVYAILAAKSRTISVMITGAGNFPVQRNQKRLATEQRRITEMLEFRVKARKAIRVAIYGPSSSNSISADDDNAPELLQARLDQLKAAHERMIQTNKLVRKGREKGEAGLRELGYSDTMIDELFRLDWRNKPIGVARFELTNSNAKIKRIEDRIKEITQTREKRNTMKDIVGDGWTISANEDDNRLWIVFEKRPDKAMSDKLKQNGFKFSPTRSSGSNSVWVRQFTHNAIWAAKKVMEVK